MIGMPRPPRARAGSARGSARARPRSPRAPGSSRAPRRSSRRRRRSGARSARVSRARICSSNSESSTTAAAPASSSRRMPSSVLRERRGRGHERDAAAAGRDRSWRGRSCRLAPLAAGMLGRVGRHVLVEVRTSAGSPPAACAHQRVRLRRGWCGSACGSAVSLSAYSRERHASARCESSRNGFSPALAHARDCSGRAASGPTAPPASAGPGPCACRCRARCSGCRR